MKEVSTTDSEATKELKQVVRKHHIKWSLITASLVLMSVAFLVLGIGFYTADGIVVYDAQFVGIIFLTAFSLVFTCAITCLVLWMNTGKTNRRKLKLSIKQDLEKFKEDLQAKIN